jgi:N-acetylglutamate synthase-like GNAT family acetyltransferase
MIAIRTATIVDVKALAELRWEFRSAQNPAVETHDAFVRRCTAWMRRELQEGREWKAWVAVHDHAIVGQVWLRTVGKIPNPVAEREQLAYLSNLYVKPSSRGGTGARLLEAVLDSCRATGINRVVLWPSTRSVTLYSKHGFSHDGDVMELKL